MKKSAKHIVCILFLLAWGRAGQSQNLLLDGINGLNSVAEGAKKLWVFFQGMDDDVNRKKMVDMAKVMNASIGRLVLAKEEVLMELDEEKFNETRYVAKIDQLLKQNNALRENIMKYNALIEISGHSAIEMSDKVSLDFMKRAKLLQDLKALLYKDNISDEAVKKELIDGLNRGINILKEAQSYLRKFKPD